MALPASGQLSLNEIHIEAGGTTGSACTINDTDIRALIAKSSGVAMNFAEWYGASAVTVTLTGGTASDTPQAPTNAVAGWKFNSDGTVDILSGTWSQYLASTNWIIPNAAAADDTYEIYVTHTGDTLQAGSAELNAWVDLDTSPQYTLIDISDDEVDRTATLLIDIRKNGGANIFTNVSFVIYVNKQGIA